MAKEGEWQEQLLTTTIQIDAAEMYKTKNIDGIIKYNLKNEIEGYCGKHGYVLKDSVQVLKRSIGKVITHNSKSKVEYNLTYKMKVILPAVKEVYTSIIDSITKMGIIAFMANVKHNPENKIEGSPILFIIPSEYEKDLSFYKVGQKIEVEVLQSRIKYRAKQIQVVGRIDR
jgi:DNA-directed RNA polymerase subunit E'/Rpb7|tara:strand:- start:184 stop:699 length:516 start_codon:yes stop_codon:yes gene_type:complete